MGGALALAAEVLSALPGLIHAGANVVNLIHQTNATLSQMKAENRDPSDAEWNALRAQITALSGQLEA